MIEATLEISCGISKLESASNTSLNRNLPPLLVLSGRLIATPWHFDNKPTTPRLIPTQSPYRRPSQRPPVSEKKVPRYQRNPYAPRDRAPTTIVTRVPDKKD